MRPEESKRKVLRAYRPMWPTRLHAISRLLTCPLDAVIASLPSSGFVVEIGCGHGVLSLLAALQNPDLHLLCTDIDAGKLHSARTAARRLGIDHRVEFQRADGMPSTTPSRIGSRADAVVCVDVLYLLGPVAAISTIDEMVASIRPEGVVLIKEMGGSPSWKVRWNHLQEIAATRILRYTTGETVEVVPAPLIRTTMEAHGLVVEETALDRHFVHPHRLLVGRRPRLRGESSGTQSNAGPQRALNRW